MAYSFKPLISPGEEDEERSRIKDDPLCRTHHFRYKEKRRHGVFVHSSLQIIRIYPFKTEQHQQRPGGPVGQTNMALKGS